MVEAAATAWRGWTSACSSVMNLVGQSPEFPWFLPVFQAQFLHPALSSIQIYFVNLLSQLNSLPVLAVQIVSLVINQESWWIQGGKKHCIEKKHWGKTQFGHIWMHTHWQAYTVLLSLIKKSGSMVVMREVAQSCPTLCNPMDCSLPRFPVHGILQAGALEW